MAASSGPEGFRFHHDQVHIGLLALVSTPAGSEKDDLFGIGCSYERLHHAGDQAIRDLGFHARLLWTRFAPE